MKATFKVHKVEQRGIVNGKHTVELVVLHPVDPYEPGPRELFRESRSGESGQIKLQVDAPAALGKFQVGRLITVSFAVE